MKFKIPTMMPLAGDDRVMLAPRMGMVQISPIDVHSDVPNMVRFHAPAIRRHLKTWEEDIEADDFLRGRDPSGQWSGWLFECVKFPKSKAYISDTEIENAPGFATRLADFHQQMLIWRGWSDLFTNIHADCVKVEVLSEIQRMARTAWKELFPDRIRIIPIPKPDTIPLGLGFEYREDWCHHCQMTTAHSNSDHDPWTFHCTNLEAHAVRPRFEN